MYYYKYKKVDYYFDIDGDPVGKGSNVLHIDMEN